MKFWWSRPDGYDPKTFQVDEDKPVFFQVGHLGKRYDSWTHVPKAGRPTFFGNFLMELTTKNSWWTIISVWVPWSAYITYTQQQKTGMNWNDVIAILCYGAAFWTFLEYCIHRFLFHAYVTSYWPITFHFAFHGVHHKWPMDPLRLVFPPTFAAPIVYLLSKLLRSFLGENVGMLATAGGVLGYTAYDVTHFALHHATIARGFYKVLKKKHMDHHWKDHLRSYGITSAFWDLVFGTLPIDRDGEESAAGSPAGKDSGSDGEAEVVKGGGKGAKVAVKRR